jgi:hypothetical protein
MGNESESEDARKLTRENERGRLDSSNDALHDEQEGGVYTVYMHCTDYQSPR